jgi:hypothetical protein
MDDLMVQIGPDTPLLRQFRILFDRAPYADCHELRRKGRKLLQDLHHRQRLIERLFDVHVRYLRSIHTEETCLVFRPDELVGDRNWATLIKPLEQALTVTSEADFRRTLIGALRRWFWFSGIEAKHMFL